MENCVDRMRRSLTRSSINDKTSCCGDAKENKDRVEKTHHSRINSPKLIRPNNSFFKKPSLSIKSCI